MTEEKAKVLKEEITDVLLCFLRDTSSAIGYDASTRVADGRMVSYHQESLNDAVSVLMCIVKES